MDCSLPGSSAHGILQARIPEWVAISFSRECHKKVSNLLLPTKTWKGSLKIWWTNWHDQIWQLCEEQTKAKEIRKNQEDWLGCLGWPKSSFGFFHSILQANPNEWTFWPTQYNTSTDSVFVFLIFFCCTVCGTLVLWPGIKPAPPALEAQSLNYWTIMEVPLV